MSQKQVVALAKRLNGQDIIWAVPASLVMRMPDGSPRLEHDGVFAAVAGTDGSAFHYFRKGLFGAAHEVLQVKELSGIDTRVVAQFGDGDQPCVSFDRKSGPSWLVFGEGEDSHQFLVGKVRELSSS
jgi:hypothetical protein